MGTNYTVNELIVSRAAKELKDNELVVIGQGIAMAAGVLARKTHAPNSVILTEAGMFGIDPFKVPLHIADPTCSRGFTYSCDMIDIFTTVVNRGYVDATFLGVGQIDRYGNMNSSYLGDPDDFTIRMTGAGGAPEFVGYANRAILTMSGGTFVNTLDYFTSPGFVTGGDSRYEAGMPEGSGPTMLITTKGVFKFAEDTKELYLAGLHPGVTVEEIKADVPWDLNVADTLEITPFPTEEELTIIRTFSPEVSMGRKLQLEVVMNRVIDLLSKNA
ncbi:MAG TPA: hypothetical protein ENN34_07200 [Deltaproteobacteria bacterium]|nr:hypothetical protein [Deltaproteobacteria bacterium]